MAAPITNGEEAQSSPSVVHVPAKLEPSTEPSTEPSAEPDEEPSAEPDEEHAEEPAEEPAEKPASLEAGPEKKWQVPRGVDLPHEEVRRWGLAGAPPSWRSETNDVLEMIIFPSMQPSVKNTGYRKGRMLTWAERNAKTRLLPTMLWADYGHNAVPVLPLISGPDMCYTGTHGVPAKLFLCVRAPYKGCNDNNRVKDLCTKQAALVIDSLREKCTAHVCKAHPHQGAMLHSALQNFSAMDWSVPTFDMMSMFLKNSSSLTVSMLLLPQAPLDVEYDLTNVLAWGGKECKTYDAATSLEKQLDRRKAEFQSSSRPKFSSNVDYHSIDNSNDKNRGNTARRVSLLKSRSSMITALNGTACAWMKTSLQNNTFGMQIKALLDMKPHPVTSEKSAASQKDPLDDDDDEDAPLMAAPSKSLTQTKLSGGKRSANYEMNILPDKKKKQKKTGGKGFIDDVASDEDGDEDEEDDEDLCSDAESIINDDVDSHGDPIDSEEEGEEEGIKRRKRLRRTDGSQLELHGQWSMSRAAEQAKQKRKGVISKSRVRDSESESGSGDEEEGESGEDGGEDEMSGEEGVDGEDEDDSDDTSPQSDDDRSVGSADDASEDSEDKKERKRFAAHKNCELTKKKKIKNKNKNKNKKPVFVAPAVRPMVRVEPNDEVLPKLLKKVVEIKLTTKSLAAVAPPEEEEPVKAAPSERSLASSSDRPLSIAARQHLEQKQQQLVPAQAITTLAPPVGQQRPHAFNRRKPIQEACMSAVDAQKRWVELALENSPPSGPLLRAPMLVCSLSGSLDNAQTTVTAFANTGKIEHAEAALHACVGLISTQRDLILSLSNSQPMAAHSDLNAAAREISLAAATLIETVMPGLNSFSSTLSQCAKLGNSLSERSQDLCVGLVDAMTKDADRLRSELETLKCQHFGAETAGTLAQQQVNQDGTLTFDQLSTTEQSAASLGVSPEEWKPISFMNNAHFETLLKNNALDDDLTRRIEAFRSVASG